METGWDDRFTVTDDEQAEWALRRIAEHEAEADRQIAVCRKFIAHYQAVLTAAEKRRDAETDYLKGLLEDYFARVPHRKTKTQESYRLPAGTLLRKRGAVRYELNEAMILAWLRQNELTDYIKTAESVKWADLKALLVPERAEMRETGEIVPGLTVAHEADKFLVQIAKED